MIKIGENNNLRIDRLTSVGLFLTDDDTAEDILLPNKYVPEAYHLGDVISVFCYLDHDERPVATTLQPYINLNEFACLRVAEVNNIGAFLDWGLEKHLFVPFSEQAAKMEEGKWYVVYMYIDKETNRLTGSGKIDQFLSNSDGSLERFDEVDVLVSRITDLGIEVIINQKFKGLLYHDEVFEDLRIGDKRKGVIKKIREDLKIDVSLQQLGFKNIEPTAQKLLEVLKRHHGFIGLHDKSDAEDIRSILGISKKSFKKAAGHLYKLKLISIQDDGIYLTDTPA